MIFFKQGELPYSASGQDNCQIDAETFYNGKGDCVTEKQ